jgi:hypothetical protein
MHFNFFLAEDKFKPGWKVTLSFVQKLKNLKRILTLMHVQDLRISKNIHDDYYCGTQSCSGIQYMLLGKIFLLAMETKGS